MPDEPWSTAAGGLPTRPTLLWSEEYTSWGLFAMAAATLSGGNTERRFSVEVSDVGLTVQQPANGGFYAWEELAAVVGSKCPDLAVLELIDGRTVTLTDGHLPHAERDRSRARVRRFDLLQRAFAASRAAS